MIAVAAQGLFGWIAIPGSTWLDTWIISLSFRGRPARGRGLYEPLPKPVGGRDEAAELRVGFLHCGRLAGIRGKATVGVQGNTPRRQDAYRRGRQRLDLLNGLQPLAPDVHDAQTHIEVSRQQLEVTDVARKARQKGPSSRVAGGAGFFGCWRAVLRPAMRRRWSGRAMKSEATDSRKSLRR